MNEQSVVAELCTYGGNKQWRWGREMWWLKGRQLLERKLEGSMTLNPGFRFFH